jgi:multisubunit Na+/H+ antiporter MnhB subunit
MNIRLPFGILCAGLFGVLSWALLSPRAVPEGLVEESLAALPRSGVKNPVTAVLLNYRGYDTLLEVAVLLLAIVGVWSLQPAPGDSLDREKRPLLLSLLRFALPVLILCSGYLLWIGAFAPGGAFQGGALLGGAMVLALLGGLLRDVLSRINLLRIGLVLGLTVFIGIAGTGVLITGSLLGYPNGLAGTLILLVESAALVSIGLTLGLLYWGGRPGDAEEQDRKAVVEPDG